MAWPRLKVVHIGNMLNRGRGKWVPGLAIFIYMVKGTTSITGRGWGT